MSANKVPGIRCALVWSDETAVLAREHNDATMVSVGGRMHALDDMTRFVEHLPRHAVPGRGAARTPDRPARRLRGDRGAARRCRRPRWAGAMPEGHTLFRNARELREAFAGLPTRVSSPQGRFAADAARARRCRGARRRVGRQAPLRRVRRRPAGPRPPRADRDLRRRHRGRRGAAAGRPGAAAAAGAAPRRRGVRRPPRRHRLRPGRPAPGGTRWSATSAPTRCATTPTPTGPGGGSGAATARSATC